MKFVSLFVIICIAVCVESENVPGFFIKVSKNIPRIGKRNNFYQSEIEELKFYNHIQPIDSKFVIDFLTKELFKADHDLRFVSWDDLDRALAKDTIFKAKLEEIAKEKKVDELKKMIEEYGDKNEVLIETPSTEPYKFYQKFIPYNANDRSAHQDFFYNVDVDKRG